MKVVLRQTFPLGRFHANPWRAFPFEDPYGEWPPSPWRILRAILARSYQYERECGVEGSGWRDEMLRAFCTSRVSWVLPSFSWRGPGLSQYQPAEFEWDPPSRTKKLRNRRVNIPGEKRYRPTLARDNFWIVGDMRTESRDYVLWWLLDGEAWSREMFDWLDASLARMTYFGRAESITEVRRVEHLPRNVDINCVLEDIPSTGSIPVLIPIAQATLEQVQAVTDAPSVKNSTVPLGAQWQYAKRPTKPPVRLPRPRRKSRVPTNLVQFAIGTRVSPTRKSVVVLTQRFRGRVIHEFLDGDWQRASRSQREAASLLTGKDADGRPLQEEHLHTRFGILFDNDTDNATRLLVWRTHPFDDDEQRAILNAAEHELQITFGRGQRKDPWAVRLVPLDSQVPVPRGFDKQAYARWETATPYVPPRHVYDRRGRVKPGETPEVQLRRELGRQEYDTSTMTIKINSGASEWVKTHRPQRNRFDPTNVEKRGYHVSLTFDTPVLGPIALGHSSHFGLGLFVPT